MMPAPELPNPNNNSGWKCILRRDWPVALFYVLLTLVLTWPVAFRIGSFIPGHGDAWKYVHDLWWCKYATLNLHQWHMHTDYLFYPIGTQLTYHTNTALNGWLSVLPQLFMRPESVYCLLWLLSWPLSCLGAYWLAMDRTGSQGASCVAGILFGFTTFHAAHSLGHLGSLTMQWIPFFVLFFLRTYRKPTLGDGLLTGFFLALASLSDWHFLLFLFVFVLFFGFYHLISHFRGLFRPRLWLYGLAGVAIFFAIAGVYLIPMLMVMGDNSGGWAQVRMPFHASIKDSADLAAYLLPSPFHPLLRNVLMPVYYEHFTANLAEASIMPGYVAYGLLFAAFFVLKGDRRWRFWAWGVLFFVLLSLGPVLMFFGVIHEVHQLPADNKILPPGQTAMVYGVPTYLLHHIPIFKISRTHARFAIIAVLCLSVISAYVLSALQKRGKGWLLVPIAALLIFELAPLPYPSSEVHCPEVYDEIAQDEWTEAIVEIPTSVGHGWGTTNINHFYQTRHQKKMADGYIARMPQYSAAIRNIPYVGKLLHEKENIVQALREPDIIISPQPAPLEVLNFFRMGYILLHTSKMSPAMVEAFRTVIEPVIPAEPMKEEYSYQSFGEEIRHEVWRYQVPRLPEEKLPPFIAFLGEKWQWKDMKTEGDKQIPYRWSRKDAEVYVYSKKAIQVKARLLLDAPQVKRALAPSWNGEPLPSREIEKKKLTEVTYTLTLQPGLNTLLLSSPPPEVEPKYPHLIFNVREIEFVPEG